MFTCNVVTSHRHLRLGVYGNLKPSNVQVSAAGNRQAFESAATTFASTASVWGLTLSIGKIKGMVVGQALSENNTGPVQVRDGS